MKGLDLLTVHAWQPFKVFGFEHAFFTVNKTYVLHTWYLLAALFLILLPIRWLLRKNNMTRFLILSYVDYFIDLSQQTIGKFMYNHVAFIVALFTFILSCNLASVVPWLEEPTRDLNTTMALGIISFLYIQYYTIKTHGIWGYIKEYFQPIFIMLPLNIVGKLASIFSISFRLFGNIFGGSIIAGIYFGIIQGSFWLELFGILSGINLTILVFFGLFEGILQAFVFSMLTLTYLSIAIKKEEPDQPTGVTQ